MSKKQIEIELMHAKVNYLFYKCLKKDKRSLVLRYLG